MHKGQAGLRLKKSCVDNIYTLNELVQGRMKSTKVQNPRRITAILHLVSSLAYCASARARELATPRVVAVTRVASGPGRFQKTAWYNLFDYPQKSGDTGYLRTLLAYLTVFYPLHGCIFTYSIRVR